MDIWVLFTFEVFMSDVALSIYLLFIFIIIFKYNYIISIN